MDDVTPSSASPVSAPPVASTATAESAPAQRPTFAEAFASDATPQPETPAQPEAATTVPTDAPAPISATPETKEGPIPFQVHKTALDNARAKEREAVAKEWEPYAWAKQVPQEKLNHIANISERMTNDRVGFLNDFYSEAVNDPKSAAEIRSWAAKTLGSKVGRSESDVPDVEIVGADNQVIGNLRDIVTRLASDLMAKEIGPIKAEREQAAKTRAQAEADAKALTAQVDAITKGVMKIVGGDQAHLEAVTKMMVEHPDWDAEECALAVRDEKIVMPRLTAKSEATVLDSLKTKAAAQAVNPSAAAVASTKRPTSFNDKTLKW